MKKTICVALTCILTACLLVACTTEIVNDNSSQAEEQSAASVDSVSVDSAELSKDESVPSRDETTSDESTDQSEESEPQYTSGDYLYTLTNDVVKLVKYIGSAEELTLPTEIDGYTLTAIEKDAFSESPKLKRLTVSDTVVNIAEGCLKPCTALEYLELGSNVTVFSAADLRELAMLEEVVVNKANTAFSSQNGILYSGGAGTLLLCPRALKVETLSLPHTLKTIEEYAFSECKGLGKVTVPAGCTLDDKAFFHCTSLTSVELPTGLEAIPQKCFFGCVKLKEITVPEGVTVIGKHAFFGCVSLGKLYLPSTIESIEEDAFKCCSVLKNISAKNDYGYQWYNEIGKDVTK